MKTYYSVLLLAVLLTGCGAGDSMAGADAAAKSASKGASAATRSAAAAEVKGEGSPAGEVKAASIKHVMPRKIIYKGEITLNTDNLDKAADLLEAKIRQAGAYVGNASRTGTKGQTRTGTWEIRVPVDEFDNLLKSVSTIGEMQSSTRNAQDVSEEFYDAQSRLNNKRVEETRLIELLKRDAGKLADVITVEHELTRVREEAEVIEGRIRFLANQSDLSTLTVTLQEVKVFTPAGPPTLMTQISRSFGGSIEVMGDFMTSVLLMLTAALPWMLLFGVLGSAGLWVWRRNRIVRA